MKRSTTSVLASFAVVAGVLVAPPATADASARAKAKGPSVTVKAKPSYAAGARVVVKGKVATERKVRRRVELQGRLVGTTWETLAEGRTNTKGAYAFRFAAPNPHSEGKVKFRVRATADKNRKLRGAWRKAGASKAVNVTFLPGDTPTPAPTLALPMACVTPEAGVQAKTADCVAALEVQAVERLWRDVQLMEKRSRSVTEMLRFGLDFVPEPKTAAEQYANLVLQSPHTMELVPVSLLESGTITYEDMLMAVTLGAFFVTGVMEGLFPGTTVRTDWKAAWTDHFLLKDTSQIVMAGDTATTPTRRFEAKKAGGKTSIEFGSTYRYTGGVWVEEWDAGELRVPARVEALPSPFS